MTFGELFPLINQMETIEIFEHYSPLEGEPYITRCLAADISWGAYSDIKDFIVERIETAGFEGLPSFGGKGKYYEVFLRIHVVRPKRE